MTIKLFDIHKQFGKHKVLTGVNLTINKGINVIIGRSGGGKSVLLKIILGLLKPDKGDIYFNDAAISSLTEAEFNQIRLKSGMVFQSGALFDSLTVEENVGFLLFEHSETSFIDIRKRVKELLSLVGLVNIEKKYPSELSGGMRKRVAIARALCLNPEIIIYDEPTTGVDPIGADMLNKLIKKLAVELKVTSLVVTHDLASAFEIADNISMLFQGGIIFSGSPRQAKDSDDSRVKQFINGLMEGPIDHVEV